VGLLEADAGLELPCMAILGRFRGGDSENRPWRTKDWEREGVTERRQTPIGGGVLSVIVAHDRDEWTESQKTMTTKGTLTADSTGSLSLAQLPPQISLASPLLASLIPLPPDPLIAYTIFEPSGALDPSLHLSTIESARRSLVSDSRSILKSLLFTVKILPRLPLLYVFAISSSGQRSPPHNALLNLRFDGLVCMSSFLVYSIWFLTRHAISTLAHVAPTASICSIFPLKGLYPCSDACSATDEPCPSCLAAPSDPLDAPFLPRPLARQFPRSPLRIVYTQLLHGIREFVSDRLGSITGSPDLLPTFRCQDGVVLTRADGFSDWGTGWIHRSRNRFVSLFARALSTPMTICISVS